MRSARLDKVLADLGLGSRKQVAALVRSGRVTVDATVVRDPKTPIDPSRAAIAVDGVRQEWRAAHHRLLNKPAGVVTTTVETEGPSVVSLLGREHAHLPWMPVGRLDRDTEGLLLLTTDGELAHRLTHPRWKVDKVYVARLAAPATPEDVAAFAAGLPLGGEVLRPAQLSWEDPLVARLVLREGRFHQVKRMFAARGNEVVALERIAFGPLSLPNDLPRGQSRPLSPEEERAIYAAVGLPTD